MASSNKIWEDIDKEFGLTPRDETSLEAPDRYTSGATYDVTEESETQRILKSAEEEILGPKVSPIAKTDGSRGWFGDMGHAGTEGIELAYARVGAAYWLAGGQDNADTISEHFRNADRPEYVQSFFKELDENSKKMEGSKGWWKWTSAFGETAADIATDPKALSYVIVENLANFLPSLGLGGVGAAAGSAAPVVGTGVGFLIGMSAGTIMTETGGKVIELMQEHGADMKDSDSIRKVMNSEGFKAEAAKQGLIKGTIIAAVDALTFRVGGKLVTAPGRALDREVTEILAKEGITPNSTVAAVAAAYAKPSVQKAVAGSLEKYLGVAGLSAAGKTALKDAGAKFASRSVFKKGVARGAAALGVESLGEGVGEFTGELAASGKAKPADALLEAFSSVGQSGAQIALAKSLHGTSKLAKSTLTRIRKEHIARVSEGVDSGIDPADINDATEAIDNAPEVVAAVNQQRIDVINSRIEREGATLTPDIVEYEDLLSDTESREFLEPVVEGLQESEGYVEYQAELQATVQEQYGDEVNLYVAVTPEDRVLLELDTPTTEAAPTAAPTEATPTVAPPKAATTAAPTEEAAPTVVTPESPDALDGFIVGSVDKAGAPSRTGTEVVRISVPASAIVARGDKTKGQVVVDATKIVSAPLTPKETPKDGAPPDLGGVAQRRAAQVTQEGQIEAVEAEFEKGQREAEVEASQKDDAAKATRRAFKDNEKPLRRIPTVKEIEVGKTEDGRRVTKPALARTIVQDKIPTEDGNRGVVNKGQDLESLKNDVKDYRLSLEKPNQMKRINRVIGKLGYKLTARGKDKQITLIDPDGKETGLGTVRVQDRTIKGYLDLIDEDISGRDFDQQRVTAREKEAAALDRVVVREKKRTADRGRVATNVDVINRRFVTRENGVVQIDEAGLDQYVGRIKEAGEWTEGELSALDRGVKRLREESRISGQSRDKSRPTPRHTVVSGTQPSPDIPGLKKVARLAGNKLRQFHARAVSLIRTGTRDELLGKMAGVFIPHGKIGATAGEGTITPNAILTLSKSVDKTRVARAYALAQSYIYSLPTVTWSKPDSSLDLDADSTSLGVHLKSSKILNDSQFGKLYKELQRMVGSDVRLIRISQNEFIVHNDSISKSQFARRVGRFHAKHGGTYGTQAEFFAATSETISHNWNEDPLGASIRHQIRESGFGDLLPFLDNRRNAFLKLAEEYGATTEDLKPRAEPTPPTPTKPKAPTVRLSMPVKPLPDMVDDGGMFSPTEAFLANWKKAKGTGKEILSVLLKAEGVNIAEAKEMGLYRFLERVGDKSISKEEVQAFVRNNRVRLINTVYEDADQAMTWWFQQDEKSRKAYELLDSRFDDIEITKGNDDQWTVGAWVDNDWHDIQQLVYDYRADQLPPSLSNKMDDGYTGVQVGDIEGAVRRVIDVAEKMVPKYYTRDFKHEIDGGEPEQVLHIPDGSDHKEILIRLGREEFVATMIERLRAEDAEGTLSPYEAHLLDQLVRGNWTHNHWPGTNVLSHIRVHQRQSYDRKGPWAHIKNWFHIDEIQSDFHHMYREDGGLEDRGVFLEDMVLAVNEIRAYELFEAALDKERSAAGPVGPDSVLTVLSGAIEDGELFDNGQSNIRGGLVIQAVEGSEHRWSIQELPGIVMEDGVAPPVDSVVNSIEKFPSFIPESEWGGALFSQSYESAAVPASMESDRFITLDEIPQGLVAPFRNLISAVNARQKAQHIAFVQRQAKQGSASFLVSQYAPFKDNWQELTFKRALVEAVRGGDSVVTWVSGTASGKRYGSFDYIESAEVVYDRHADRYYARWETANGRREGRVGLTEEELKDTLGNKLAKRMIKDSHNGTTEIPRVEIKRTEPFDADVHPEDYGPEGFEYEVRAYPLFDEHSGIEESTWTVVGTAKSEKQAQGIVETYLWSINGAAQVRTQYKKLNVRLGGELHTTIYDKILPTFAKRLAKRYPGSKVEQVLLPVQGEPIDIKLHVTKFNQTNETDEEIAHATVEISDENGLYEFTVDVSTKMATEKWVGKRPDIEVYFEGHDTERSIDRVTRFPFGTPLDEIVDELNHLVNRDRQNPYLVWRLEMSPEMVKDMGQQPMYSLPHEIPLKPPHKAPPPEPASGGFFNAQLRKELTDQFGEKNVANLESQGILKIIQSPTQLPMHLYNDKYATAEALYDDKSGVSYLISQNIADGTAPSVLMHEVGVHFGLRRMVGDAQFADMLNLLLDGKDSKEFAPYFAQVKKAYEKLIESGDIVEDSEEFLEEVIAKIAQDPNALKMSFVQELFRRIRVFLSKHFEGIDLTAKDIQAIVRGSLRKSMKGEINIRGEIERSPVFASFYTDSFDEERRFYNFLSRRDDVYKDFPPNPKTSATDKLKQAEFSQPKTDKGIAKMARKKLAKALEATEEIFYRLSKGHKVIIDFPHDQNGKAVTSSSERIVRIHSNASDRMLVFRFGYEPIDPQKLAMLGPVVDFGDMGNFSKQGEYKLDRIAKDIEVAITLFLDGKLDDDSALSMWLDHRLGTTPSRLILPDLDMKAGGRDNYLTYVGRMWSERPDRARLMKEQELLAVEQGFLKAPHMPVVNSAGRVSYSMPDTSHDDLSDADIAVLNRTNGGNKRRPLLSHLERIRTEGLLWFTQKGIDRYRSVRNKLGEEGGRAWMMMHMSDNAAGLMHSVFNFGKPVERTLNGQFDGYEVDPDSKGLIEILQGLDGEVDRFLGWVVGHRAKKLMREGRERNFSQEDIDHLTGMARGKMASGQQRKLLYSQTMREMSKFQSQILDIAVSAGTITKEDRDALVTDFYIPFYREFEQDGATSVRGPSMTSDFVNIKDVIRKLRGSELDTNDVMHNLMMNYTALLNSSLKNRAGVSALLAAVKMGVAERVAIDPQEAAKLEFGKRKSRTDKYKDHVYVLEGGKKVWYKVNDEMVLESLLSMNQGGIDNGTIRAFSTFKRWFTIGVTASPAFKIRNLLRDSLHSIAVGEMSYNVFGNVAKGLKTARKKDPIYQSLLASGGAFSFGFLHDDPSAVRRLLARGVKRNQVIDTSAKARKAMVKMVDVYADFGNQMENANRVALYLNRVDEVGHLQASFEARDLLNFSSHGSATAVQVLISMVPFLNARIQGLDKLGRALTTEQRGRALAVTGTIVLASILHELSMDEDEEYKRLPDWVRDTYWPVKLPGEDTWLYIPKPFEIGAIASVGQRLTQQFIDDSVEPKFFAKRVAEIMMDQLAFDPRPQLFKPVAEVMFNYDSFKDRRIESLGWQIGGTPKHKMKHPSSSDVSMLTSDAFYSVFGKSPISPVQIDHLIKGYFGWLGATTVGLFDLVLYPSEPEQPTKRWDEMYGLVPIGSFYKTGPLKSTQQGNLFWEQLNEIREHHALYKEYLERGTDEELKAFLAKNQMSLVWRKNYEGMQRHLGVINKKMRAVYDSTVMSADEKRATIDDLITAKNDAAEGLINLRIQAEKPMKVTMDVPSTPIQLISSAHAEDAQASSNVETDYDVRGLQQMLQQSEGNRRNVDNLYDSVFAAEFRGIDRLRPFIRTRHAPKDGSSAYGPLQITVGLMEDAQSQMKLTDVEAEYVERFIEQGRKFLEFGREPNKPGYHKRYDYGGEGDLTSANDKRLYKRVGKKLVALIWEQAGRDWEKFVNDWRYGAGSEKDVATNDKKYLEAFQDKYEG